MKEAERATSSFRYISEAITKKVLKNSPCINVGLRYKGIGK